jgi:uncharacterized protein (DUF1810 family)
MTNSLPDVSRFEKAHEAQFVDALSEMRAGQKTSHWMWFIFPQATGISSSETAQFYGIRSLTDALAFFDHRVLGANYRLITSAVYNQAVGRSTPLIKLLGKPDDLKLISSLELFRAVSAESTADAAAFLKDSGRILEVARAAGYPSCERTRLFLDQQTGKPGPT